MTTTRATPHPETDARLTEHRLEPRLDKIDEPGDETPRGTFGRGRLGVEVGALTSALDGSSGDDASAAPVLHLLRDRIGVPNSAELLASRALLSDPPTMATIGGSTTMSLHTFNRATSFPGVDALRRTAATPVGPDTAPSPASMRVMETGLALVAIAVALLLNLGR